MPTENGRNLVIRRDTAAYDESQYKEPLRLVTDIPQTSVNAVHSGEPSEPNSENQYSDGTDLNGEGSECEPGQQWTQVGRAANNRTKQRKKPTSPKRGFASNGYSGDVTFIRPASFRGTRDYAPMHRPYRYPGMVRGRHSYHESGHLPNGYNNQPDRMVKSTTGLGVDTNLSGVHTSTASSPSPTISSPDMHHGSGYQEDKSFQRPQQRINRPPRKPYAPMEDDALSAESVTSHTTPRPSLPPNTQNIESTYHGAGRPPAPMISGRTIRNPVPTNGMGSHADEHWRRPPPNYRRSYQFGPRGQGPYHYNRFNGPAPPPHMPTHNPMRFRGSYHSSATEQVSLVDHSKDSTSENPVTVSGELPTPIAEATTDTPQPPVTEKRTGTTSWAAAVAAVPTRSAELTEQPVMTTIAATATPLMQPEPSQTHVLNFLLDQWRLFRQHV